MSERNIENNIVNISGEIVSDFEFSHEVYGENFYIANLSVKRASGTLDVIPIMVSDRVFNTTEKMAGQYVKAVGQLRSYNKHEADKNKLILSVFARELETLSREAAETADDVNIIFIDGYVCKKPNYRETPLGREISDVFLAVNRPYGKSDYIPCIVWGRNARFAGNLEIGARLQICGRIQSREYIKKINDEEAEKRIAYEVSASKIDVIEETED